MVRHSNCDIFFHQRYMIHKSPMNDFDHRGSRNPAFHYKTNTPRANVALRGPQGDIRVISKTS